MDQAGKGLLQATKLPIIVTHPYNEFKLRNWKHSSIEKQPEGYDHKNVAQLPHQALDGMEQSSRFYNSYTTKSHKLPWPSSSMQQL